MQDKILSELQEIKEQLNELQEQTPEIMTVSQAANFLNISESKLRRLVRDKKIPVNRIDGNMLRFSKQKLILWFEFNKTSFTKRDRKKIEGIYG